MPKHYRTVFATLRFMRKKVFGSLIVLFFALFGVTSSLAYDGDMDEYHAFKEELALARDSYVTCMNMVADESPEKIGGGWDAIEFEAPETAFVKLAEIPGGFRISGSHGAYKLDAEVRFKLKEGDVVFEVKHKKGSNAPGKEIAGEVFR